MKTVPLLIGRRKRGLRSFSSRLETASFLGSAARKRRWRSIQMKQLGLVTAVIATLALALSAGLAQQKTLYVAGYGGSFEKTIRDAVIPDFEKANGVKVEYV